MKGTAYIFSRWLPWDARRKAGTDVRRAENSWPHSAGTKWALQPHAGISDTAWLTAWACGHPVGANVNIIHWPAGGIVRSLLQPWGWDVPGTQR